VHKDLGGMQPGQLIQVNQRDIPYNITSCSTTKSGKDGGRGKFGMMLFVSPSNHYALWTPAALKMAEHLPVNGK